MVLHKNKWDKRATRNYYRKHGITPPGVQEKKQQEGEPKSRDAWKQDEVDDISSSSDEVNDENSIQDKNDQSETKINRAQGLGDNAWRYREEETEELLTQEPEPPLDYSKLASRSILSDERSDVNIPHKIKDQEIQEFTNLAAKIEQQKKIKAYRERYKVKPSVSRPSVGKIARPKKVSVGDCSDDDYQPAPRQTADNEEQDIDEFLASLDLQNKQQQLSSSQEEEEEEDFPSDSHSESSAFEHRYSNDTKRDEETLDQLLNS